MEALVRYSKGDKKVVNAMTSHLNFPPPNNLNKVPQNVSSNNVQNQSFKGEKGSKNVSREMPSMQVNYSSNSGRNLTLKQLKDTI